MNTIKNRFAVLSMLLLVILTGCRDKTVTIFEANVPVMETWTEFRSKNFQMEAGRDLHNAGKIYLYQNLLLVNEVFKGVHFFDNTNPANPVNLGFLPVHGNVDMAVRNNILYLDNYTDLVSFDISDPSNPVFVNRFDNAFQPTNYQLVDGYQSNYPMAIFDDTEGVIVGWKIEKVKEEGPGTYYNVDMLMDNFTSSGGGRTNIGGTGKAGSMSRFAIEDAYLYTLELSELTTYNISDGISQTSKIALNLSAETIFPYNNHLFIGTNTGMLIYSIASPSSPAFISVYSHITACDPVVVEGNTAYVTLRTGNNCFGSVNTLDVVDISNLAAPQLTHSFNMTNPHGLGLDGNLLFLCDGADGLKIFDKTSPADIPSNLVAHFPGMQTFDVIPYNQLAIMTSEEGIYQYSYADPQNMVMLSLIPVVQ